LKHYKKTLICTPELFQTIIRKDLGALDE